MIWLILLILLCGDFAVLQAPRFKGLLFDPFSAGGKHMVYRRLWYFLEPTVFNYRL
jgi:hypothetical protein